MVYYILLILGLVVVIAVTGHKIFNKTGVPESVFMLLFGLILGPGLNIISLTDIQLLVPYVFTLSIIIILLESGLSTQISDVLKTMKISIFFTIIVMFVTTIICGLFIHVVLRWDLLPSIILGLICSGTSTLPILYFTEKMDLGIKVNQLLIFESIFNDVTIITSITLIIQFITLQYNPTITILNLIHNLINSIIFGLFGSVIWMLALIPILEGLKFKYILTLAIAVILYSIAEAFGASGVITVLIYGVSIGNLPIFFRDRSLFIGARVFLKKASRVFSHIQIMQDEVTFLVKNMFFFILGLLFDRSALNSNIFLISVSLSGFMVISRFISVQILSVLDSHYREYIWAISLMLPRGLTAGIAALLPLEKGIEIPFLMDIIIVMLILTNIASTIGFMIFSRSRS